MCLTITIALHRAHWQLYVRSIESLLDHNRARELLICDREALGRRHQFLLILLLGDDFRVRRPKFTMVEKSILVCFHAFQRLLRW